MRDIAHRVVLPVSASPIHQRPQEVAQHLTAVIGIQEQQVAGAKVQNRQGRQAERLPPPLLFRGGKPEPRGAAQDPALLQHLQLRPRLLPGRFCCQTGEFLALLCPRPVLFPLDFGSAWMILCCL
jgi:hypothetical protein